jgi:hypothetical protein
MKKKMTRAELERFILAEIAQSERCPKSLRIRIEARDEGRWAVIPLDQTEGTNPMCVKRIASIEARFQVDFELVDEAAN